MPDVKKERMEMDERRLAALETLSGVIRWLRETKPSEIFYASEGEGKGKAIVPTVGEEHLRLIWQRWTAKASEILERSAIVPDLLLDDLEHLFKQDDKEEKVRGPQT